MVSYNTKYKIVFYLPPSSSLDCKGLENHLKNIAKEKLTGVLNDIAINMMDRGIKTISSDSISNTSASHCFEVDINLIATWETLKGLNPHILLNDVYKDFVKTYKAQVVFLYQCYPEVSLLAIA